MAAGLRAFPCHRHSGIQRSLDSSTVAGAAPESSPIPSLEQALTGFPVSLCRPPATEHLKQVAKVRGLGVERQLKPAVAHRTKLHCINKMTPILCHTQSSDIK
nr:hypothetical protein FFPRI1PSEUD_51780 [Pseudomonas sp. FFPRI_1]